MEQISLNCRHGVETEIILKLLNHFVAEYAKKFLENSKYRVKSGKSIGPLGKTLFGITTISITSELMTDLLRQNKSIPTDLKQGLLVWKVIQDSPAAR